MDDVLTMVIVGKCVWYSYKVTCRKCECFYIGNMQHKMKNWQRQHLDDVKKLIMRGKHSDSFAAHFVGHCTSGVKPSNKELREMMKYQII